MSSSAKADPPSSGGAPGAATAEPAPKSAREAVERGQQCFDRRQYAEALQLFQAALELRPDEDEARAALYNGSCAHARLKQWKAAADGVVRAVNEYSLKLEVAAKVRALIAAVTAAPRLLSLPRLSRHWSRMHACPGLLTHTATKSRPCGVLALQFYPCCVHPAMSESSEACVLAQQRARDHAQQPSPKNSEHAVHAMHRTPTWRRCASGASGWTRWR